MTDHGFEGRATGRQQILHLLREACANASALCENSFVDPSLWRDRAKSAVRSCGMLQRAVVNSHPQLADELHILSTEIQIALAAQPHQPLFAERVQRIRDAVLRLQQSRIEADRPDERGGPVI
ncbi:MAG: hypothetical protein ACO1NY_04680 [Pseudorhodoplanes sp.]